MRVVTQTTDWDSARADCNATGEALAVFDTYESVQWFLSFLKNETTPTGKSSQCSVRKMLQ